MNLASQRIWYKLFQLFDELKWRTTDTQLYKNVLDFYLPAFKMLLGV